MSYEVDLGALRGGTSRGAGTIGKPRSGNTSERSAPPPPTPSRGSAPTAVAAAKSRSGNRKARSATSAAKEKASAKAKKGSKAKSDAKRAAALMKSKGYGLEQAWKAVGGDHDVLAAVLARVQGNTLGDTYLFGFGAVTLTAADLDPIAKQVAATLKAEGITSPSPMPVPAMFAASAAARSLPTKSTIAASPTILQKLAARDTAPTKPAPEAPEAPAAGIPTAYLAVGGALLGLVALLALRRKKG